MKLSDFGSSHLSRLINGESELDSEISIEGEREFIEERLIPLGGKKSRKPRNEFDSEMLESHDGLEANKIMDPTFIMESITNPEPEENRHRNKNLTML